MNNLVKSLMCFGVLTLTTSAFAGSESGFYIGGSIGNTEVDYSDDNPSFDVDFDDDDNGYKVFGGYNFGIVPLIDIAVEGAYVDFGEVAGTISAIDSSAEIEGMTLAGLVGFNLGPVGLFGKVGVINWDTDIKSFSVDESDSGTDPLYGIGAKLQFGSVQVRAEYEMFELDNFDVDYFSIGAAYVF